MKTRLFGIYTIGAFLAVALTGCRDEMTEFGGNAPEGSGVTFHISAPGGESGTRGEIDNVSIVSLCYLLADKEGRVLTHCSGLLSEGLDKLSFDGIGAGDYTIVFLGSSMESELARIETPATLDETWLENTVRTLPIEGSYFFKKVDFYVDPQNMEDNYDVVLDRAVSKIKIEFPCLPAAVEAMISSVKLTLDDDTPVYSAIKADGEYTGEARINGFEMCDPGFNLSLNTLPSCRPLSGTVKVKAGTLSGDSISTTFRFSDLNAEAGKVNRISISLPHPDMKTGFLRIRPKDYFDFDADLMLMEDEPMTILHDADQRHFSLTNPLVLKTWSNQLRLQFYSAAPAENVDIYANFPSLGIDSVHIAHLDKVEALLDMLIPMTFTKREAQYLDIHGKRVTLPRMDIPSNIEWIVVSDDPFLMKMSQLSLKKWSVGFHNWEEVWPSKAISPDTKAMRHAMVQMINLALTLDSEEFAEEIAAHEGQYVDNGIYYSNNEIVERIQDGYGRSYGLGACNPSCGNHGWGGGMDSGYISIIVDQEYFERMYPTESPETPCNRERECFYHEFSHCLGFSHDGNMTYGSVWTNTIGAAYIRAHQAGKIFFFSPDFINSIPYRRSDAPQWAASWL